MVSNSDNPNYLFMEPFIKWIQEVYQESTGLRIFKRLTNNQKTGSYCVLTNIGKKKTDEPITVYCKLKKFSMMNLSFEIYDTIVHKHIYFEVNAESFNFNHRLIDEETINNSANYIERPFLDERISVDMGLSTTSSPVPQSPAPPSSSTSTPTTTSTSLDNEASAREITLLKKELERSTCENVILQMEKDALLKKLLSSVPSDQFNIMNFNVIKLLTYSLGVKVYAVENKETQQKYNLKEIILDPYLSRSSKLLGLELKTLNELRGSHLEDQTGRRKHISYLLGKFEDLTIIRRSHYILTEPSVLNLEEFAFHYMKTNKRLAPFVITQILKGLDYLDTTIKKIHGNIDLRSIVVDSNWTIKLTNFEMSQRIGEQVDPIEFINAENDLLIKHPHIFEKIEEKQPLTVGYFIDNWALGCLFFKLITDSDMFLGCSHHKDHMSISRKIMETFDTKLPGVPIGTFFHDAALEISPGMLLNSDYFKRYYNEEIGRYVQANGAP